jgi:hypothetical protein
MKRSTPGIARRDVGQLMDIPIIHVKSETTKASLMAQKQRLAACGIQIPALTLKG